MKILVADDDRVSRQIIVTALGRLDYEVVTAVDGTEALAALQAPDAPKLAILDWMMPGLDGLEVCRRVRERGTAPYVYIVLLTAKDTRQDMVTGLESGADDFLVKPFDAAELGARLRTDRRILEIQDALMAAQKTLRFEATHDHLTGAANRGTILDRLGRELDRSGREGQPTAVLLADLDHFKRVNDHHGHAAGDRVLCAAVERMQALVRPYDAVGRYGGEEFLIVLHRCDRTTAAMLAERIRERIAGEPIPVDGGAVSITVSLGVAACAPGGLVTPESLIGAADAALYRAKGAGRNRVEIAAEEEIDRGR